MNPLQKLKMEQATASPSKNKLKQETAIPETRAYDLSGDRHSDPSSNHVSRPSQRIEDVVGTPHAEASRCPVSEPLKKMIEWDENNNPVPTTKRSHTAQSIKEIAKAAASAIYTNEDDINMAYPEFYGMTYIEVAMLRIAKQAANGDQSATNIILDRTIGKPKQTVESTKINLSYQDFLDNITKTASESPEPRERPVVELTNRQDTYTRADQEHHVYESPEPPETDANIEEAVIDI